MKIVITTAITFLILLGSALILASILKDNTYYKRRALGLEVTLRQKEQAASRYLIDLQNTPDDSAFIEKGKEWINSGLNEFEKQNIHLFLYLNDSLKVWSTSNIPMPSYLFDEGFVFNVIKLKNGWYRVVKWQKDHRMAVCLILIKHEYPIQNKFLQNKFPEEYEITEKARISTDPEAQGHVISDAGEHFLFVLQFEEEALHERRFPLAAGIFYIFSMVALIYLLYSLRMIPWFRKHKMFHIFLFAAIACIGRYYMITYKFPKVIYSLPLFSPEYFASSRFLPSLGDFMLNIVLITLLLGLIFQRYFKLKFKHTASRFVRYTMLIVTGMMMAFTSLGINILFGKLILDSRISFNLLNLLELDIYSVLGFILITLLLLNFLILSHFFSRLFMRSRNFKLWEFVLFSSLAFTAIYIGCFLLYNTDAGWLFFPLSAYLTVGFINFKRQKELNFYSLAPVLIIFSIYSTYLLFKFNIEKENETRKSLALKISDQQDHIAEYLFMDVQEKLRKDLVIRQYLEEFDEFYPKEFFLRIGQNYFNGYWLKYALYITPFRSEFRDAYVEGRPGDPMLSGYERDIERFGIPTSSDYLFYINNPSGKVNYIARIPISRNGQDSASHYLYIEFNSKAVTQVAGFPELLLDKSIKRPVDIGSYSYAVYKNDNLATSGGSFIYPIRDTEFSGGENEFTFVRYNGFNHLVYRNAGNNIIISRRQNNIQDFLNPFAYLLIFFVTILFLYYGLQYLFLNQNRALRFHFKTRIQLSILLILIASLIVIGVGIYYYIIQQFDRKNKLNITEKINSIQNQLNDDLISSHALEGRYDPSLNIFLQELSNIFFTDINIYNQDGYLVATSRESIYNEGVISRNMNPAAYKALSVDLQKSYIHIDKIAGFEYLSAYAVIRNPDNSIAGFINLPYFLRQKEVREELSSSLLALLNIYSLLIVLSMIVTFVIANQLTIPLEMLQEKIGRIRLGRKNEIIDYRANDEIGGLVAEYNRMIRELEKSAELLAQSERESAWKEMARQVAHEVKNPLTPMKLNVQYLLKAWEDQKPDFGERLKKFHVSMIEQIETLSSIASEFSYFAKMPEAFRQEIDLGDVLKNCIEFFTNHDHALHLEFINETTGKTAILADRDQMVRVFNNVIRNAVQAIPEERQGRIIVKLTRKGSIFEISIRDNGSGIPEEVRDKIFSPNFTTKNSGMGLGLSMTKTIIENMNGEIFFETYENAGTTFYIRIPVFTGQ